MIRPTWPESVLAADVVSAGRCSLPFSQIPLRIPNFRPDKFFSLNGDAPFEPGFIPRIPAKTMHRKRIQQFVRENDAVAVGQRRILDLRTPPDPGRKRRQTLPLPFLPARRGFDQHIFHPFKQAGLVGLEPVQNVLRQFSVVRSGLDQAPAAVRRRHGLQPPGKLERQQLPKQAPHAHAGDKVPLQPNRVLFCLVVASFRTIQGQFHEPGERNYAAFDDFFADRVFRHFHCLQSCMGLISVAETELM